MVRNVLSERRLFWRAQFAVVALVMITGLAGARSLQAAQDENKALKERATAFWEARVKGDWGTVYDFLPDAEKQAGSKEQFVAFTKENGPFNYLSYKLQEVDVEGGVGWVKTAYDMEPMRFKGLTPNHLEAWQTWEMRDGKWYPVSGESEKEVPKRPPRLRPLEVEKAVMARADEFWQAREKNDYASVYQLCAPAFKEKVSSQEFLAKKALNSYVGHTIHWAEVNGDRAKVRVTFSYRPNDPHLTKMEPTQKTIMQEWIKVNNQWYLDARGS